MSYASISGRARTSSTRPRAFAVCDRCGIWYNRDVLNFQFDWRGTALQNLWILVCKRCLDVPQEQLRSIILPADPTPIWQPRTENFEVDEADLRTVLPIPVDPVVGIPVPAKAALRVTEDCQNRITQPLGCPSGLEQNAVNSGVPGPFAKAPPGIGVPLQLLSVTSNGTTTIQVTCSAPHGLKTNGQIAAEGLAAANGMYSVIVLSATAFTYSTTYNVQAAALLTSTTRIVTALVGLPRGSATIPLRGCGPTPPTRGVVPPPSGQYGIVPGGQAAILPGGEGIITP